MCNENRFSESGAPIAAARCADFLLLRSDRDRLAGVVVGMDDQNARNMDALRLDNGQDQPAGTGRVSGLCGGEGGRIWSRP